MSTSHETITKHIAAFGSPQWKFWVSRDAHFKAICQAALASEAMAIVTVI